MSKKYELIRNNVEIILNPACRVYATRRLLDNVKVGNIGGWIEKEENLSHSGNAWVGGNAEIRGNATVCGDAWVGGLAKVRDDATVCGNAVVRGNAVIEGNARIRDNAVVGGNAVVRDNATVEGSAAIKGDAVIGGSAVIGGNALIENESDYICIDPIDGKDNCITFYRTKDDGIEVSCADFLGTLNDFLIRVWEKHMSNDCIQQYQAAAELAKRKILGK